MAPDARDVVYPSVELIECPYPVFELLQEEAPVHKVPGRDEYLVSRYEDIVYVLRHPEVFSNALARQARGQGDGSEANASTIASDPPAHKAKRALTYSGFTPGRLRTYESVIQSITDTLIDSFIDKGAVEFVEDFASPLPILVFCELFFGNAREDYEKFRRWALLDGSGARYLPGERLEAGEERRRGMKEYLEATILDRHERPRDDILSEMIQKQVERDGALNLPYLRAEAGLLLAGGFVTTAHMIASAMLLMLQNPVQMASVRADHSRIPGMVEEALRVESPVQWQHRVAAIDTEIGGVQVPAGSMLVVMLGAGNRDKAKFEHPEVFDIEREDSNRHLAFGFGAHFCLGAPLGRLEGRIAFERLLHRLDEIELAENNDFTHLDSPLFRGPSSLHLVFKRS